MGNQFSGLEAALKQLEAGLVGKAATPSSTVNVAQTFAWALPYWSSDAEAKIRFALPGCKNPKILDALLEALSNELRNVNLVSRDYAFEADKVMVLLTLTEKLLSAKPLYKHAARVNWAPLVLCVRVAMRTLNLPVLMHALAVVLAVIERVGFTERKVSSKEHNQVRREAAAKANFFSAGGLDALLECVACLHPRSSPLLVDAVLRLLVSIIASHQDSTPFDAVPHAASSLQSYHALLWEWSRSDYPRLRVSACALLRALWMEGTEEDATAMQKCALEWGALLWHLRLSLAPVAGDAPLANLSPFEVSVLKQLWAHEGVPLESEATLRCDTSQALLHDRAAGQPNAPAVVARLSDHILAREASREMVALICFRNADALSVVERVLPPQVLTYMAVTHNAVLSSQLLARVQVKQEGVVTSVGARDKLSVDASLFISPASRFAPSRAAAAQLGSESSETGGSVLRRTSTAFVSSPTTTTPPAASGPPELCVPKLWKVEADMPVGINARGLLWWDASLCSPTSKRVQRTALQNRVKVRWCGIVPARSNVTHDVGEVEEDGLIGVADDWGLASKAAGATSPPTSPSSMSPAAGSRASVRRSTSFAVNASGLVVSSSAAAAKEAAALSVAFASASFTLQSLNQPWQLLWQTLTAAPIQTHLCVWTRTALQELREALWMEEAGLDRLRRASKRHTQERGLLQSTLGVARMIAGAGRNTDDVASATGTAPGTSTPKSSLTAGSGAAAAGGAQGNAGAAADGSGSTAAKSRAWFGVEDALDRSLAIPDVRTVHVERLKDSSAVTWPQPVVPWPHANFGVRYATLQDYLHVDGIYIAHLLPKLQALSVDSKTATVVGDVSLPQTFVPTLATALTLEANPRRKFALLQTARVLCQLIIADANSGAASVQDSLAFSALTGIRAVALVDGSLATTASQRLGLTPQSLTHPPLLRFLALLISQCNAGIGDVRVVAPLGGVDAAVHAVSDNRAFIPWPTAATSTGAPAESSAHTGASPCVSGRAFAWGSHMRVLCADAEAASAATPADMVVQRRLTPVGESVHWLYLWRQEALLSMRWLLRVPANVQTLIMARGPDAFAPLLPLLLLPPGTPSEPMPGREAAPASASAGMATGSANDATRDSTDASPSGSEAASSGGAPVVAVPVAAPAAQASTTLTVPAPSTLAQGEVSSGGTPKSQSSSSLRSQVFVNTASAEPLSVQGDAACVLRTALSCDDVIPQQTARISTLPTAGASSAGASAGAPDYDTDLGERLLDPDTALRVSQTWMPLCALGRAAADALLAAVQAWPGCSRYLAREDVLSALVLPLLQAPRHPRIIATILKVLRCAVPYLGAYLPAVRRHAIFQALLLTALPAAVSSASGAVDKGGDIVMGDGGLTQDAAHLLFDLHLASFDCTTYGWLQSSCIDARSASKLMLDVPATDAASAPTDTKSVTEYTWSAASAATEAAAADAGSSLSLLLPAAMVRVLRTQGASAFAAIFNADVHISPAAMWSSALRGVLFQSLRRQLQPLIAWVQGSGRSTPGTASTRGLNELLLADMHPCAADQCDAHNRMMGVRAAASISKAGGVALGYSGQPQCAGGLVLAYPPTRFMPEAARVVYPDLDDEPRVCDIYLRVFISGTHMPKDMNLFTRSLLLCCQEEACKFAAAHLKLVQFEQGALAASASASAAAVAAPDENDTPKRKAALLLNAYRRHHFRLLLALQALRRVLVDAPGTRWEAPALHMLIAIMNLALGRYPSTSLTASVLEASPAMGSPSAAANGGGTGDVSPSAAIMDLLNAALHPDASFALPQATNAPTLTFLLPPEAVHSCLRRGNGDSDDEEGGVHSGHSSDVDDDEDADVPSDLPLKAEVRRQPAEQPSTGAAGGSAASVTGRSQAGGSMPRMLRNAVFYPVESAVHALAVRELLTGRKTSASLKALAQPDAQLLNAHLRAVGDARGSTPGASVTGLFVGTDSPSLLSLALDIAFHVMKPHTQTAVSRKCVGAAVDGRVCHSLVAVMAHLFPLTPAHCAPMLASLGFEAGRSPAASAFDERDPAWRCAGLDILGEEQRRRLVLGAPLVVHILRTLAFVAESETGTQMFINFPAFLPPILRAVRAPHAYGCETTLDEDASMLKKADTSTSRSASRTASTSATQLWTPPLAVCISAAWRFVSPAAGVLRALSSVFALRRTFLDIGAPAVLLHSAYGGADALASSAPASSLTGAGKRASMGGLAGRRSVKAVRSGPRFSIGVGIGAGGPPVALLSESDLRGVEEAKEEGDESAAGSGGDAGVAQEAFDCEDVTQGQGLGEVHVLQLWRLREACESVLQLLLDKSGAAGEAGSTPSNPAAASNDILDDIAAEAALAMGGGNDDAPARAVAATNAAVGGLAALRSPTISAASGPPRKASMSASLFRSALASPGSSGNNSGGSNSPMLARAPSMGSFAAAMNERSVRRAPPTHEHMLAMRALSAAVAGLVTPAVASLLTPTLVAPATSCLHTLLSTGSSAQTGVVWQPAMRRRLVSRLAYEMLYIDNRTLMAQLQDKLLRATAFAGPTAAGGGGGGMAASSRAISPRGGGLSNASDLRILPCLWAPERYAEEDCFRQLYPELSDELLVAGVYVRAYTSSDMDSVKPDPITMCGNLLGELNSMQRAYPRESDLMPAHVLSNVRLIVQALLDIAARVPTAAAALTKHTLLSSAASLFSRELRQYAATISAATRGDADAGRDARLEEQWQQVTLLLLRLFVVLVGSASAATAAATHLHAIHMLLRREELEGSSFATVPATRQADDADASALPDTMRKEVRGSVAALNASLDDEDDPSSCAPTAHAGAGAGSSAIPVPTPAPAPTPASAPTNDAAAPARNAMEALARLHTWSKSALALALIAQITRHLPSARQEALQTGVVASCLTVLTQAMQPQSLLKRQLTVQVLAACMGAVPPAASMEAAGGRASTLTHALILAPPATTKTAATAYPVSSGAAESAVHEYVLQVLWPLFSHAARHAAALEYGWTLPTMLLNVFDGVFSGPSLVWDAHARADVAAFLAPDWALLSEPLSVNITSPAPYRVANATSMIRRPYMDAQLFAGDVFVREYLQKPFYRDMVPAAFSMALCERLRTSLSAVAGSAGAVTAAAGSGAPSAAADAACMWQALRHVTELHSAEAAPAVAAAWPSLCAYAAEGVGSEVLCNFAATIPVMLRSECVLDAAGACAQRTAAALVTLTALLQRLPATTGARITATAAPGSASATGDALALLLNAIGDAVRRSPALAKALTDAGILLPLLAALCSAAESDASQLDSSARASAALIGLLVTSKDVGSFVADVIADLLTGEFIVSGVCESSSAALMTAFAAEHEDVISGRRWDAAARAALQRFISSQVSALLPAATACAAGDSSQCVAWSPTAIRVLHATPIDLAAVHAAHGSA